ncbi:MAG TPA: EamA family transporter [Thermoleophilaceae bacterium]
MSATARTWIALATVYVVWGSTYLGIRVVVKTMPPLLAGGVRFMLAGSIMCAALAVKRGRGYLRVSRDELIGAALVGSLLVTGGNGVVMVAEQHVASGLAALIMASIPLWVVLFRRVWGESIQPAVLAGVAIGFAGVALLVGPGANGGSSAGWLVVLVGAAFCWALGTFGAGRVEIPRDPLLATGWQMLLGGLLSLAIGLAVGEAADVRFSEFSSDSLWAFAYLVVFGSLVAFTAYTYLLQNVPASKAATYAYVNPVIAVFLGWLILDESITWLVVVAAAVIVSSVAVIVRHETTQEPEAALVPAEGRSDGREGDEERAAVA